MSEKHKSPSSIEIQVKNQQRSFSIEEKLNISYLKKVNKSLTYVIMSDSLIVAHIQLVNADSIKESAKSGTKVFVFVVRLPHSCQKEQYQKLWM